MRQAAIPDGAISDSAREELERALRKRNVSVEELASRVGVSTSYLSRIKNQRRRANLEVLHNIANVLRIDPAVLTQQDMRVPTKGSPMRQIATELRRLRQDADRWIQMLDMLDRENIPVLRIAEAKAEHRLAGQPAVPVIDGAGGRKLLNRLAQRGRLGEVAAGEPRLAIMIELPESARDDAEVDELYRSTEYTEHVE